MGNWKQKTDTDDFKFGVNLRIPGNPDDAAQQDENYMQDTKDKLEK